MKNLPIVLVVEDDRAIVHLLSTILDANDYRVVQVSTGREALSTISSHCPDVVLLDLGLPDMDGVDIIKNVRQWSQVPVIMLTVRDGEAEKVAALDGGANDYVTKPFGVQELMARIRGLLRARIVPADTAMPLFDDGHLHVDLGRREVTLDGEPVALSRKEFALLALLLQHAGRVVTQPKLLRELWGPDHQDDTHYLRILVGKLRQKIGDDATAPRYIATEPGVGLRFVGVG